MPSLALVLLALVFAVLTAVLRKLSIREARRGRVDNAVILGLMAVASALASLLFFIWGLSGLVETHLS